MTAIVAALLLLALAAPASGAGAGDARVVRLENGFTVRVRLAACVFAATEPAGAGTSVDGPW